MAAVARLDLARLDDLSVVLNELRSWPGVDEPSPATFYVKSQPFLHFHVGADSRRADVKCADGWEQVDLPEPCPAGVARRLHRLLSVEYRRRTAKP